MKKDSSDLFTIFVGGCLVGILLFSVILVGMDPIERGKGLAAQYICESNQASLVKYNFSSSDWFVQCQQTSYYSEPMLHGIVVMGSEGDEQPVLKCTITGPDSGSGVVGMCR